MKPQIFNPQLTAHTPGPWSVAQYNPEESFDIHASCGECENAHWVASVRSVQVGKDYAHANALLIAAAPELLAALEVIAGMEFDFDMTAKHCIEALKIPARQALAKARGETGHGVQS